MAHKMAIHAENYTKGVVGSLEKHNYRENESYSNPDINIEHSKDNIIIKRPEVSQYKDSQKIIQERATNQVRKTSIWQVEFIISSDKEFFNALPMDEQQRFFQEAYKFLVKEFGKENVTSAVAHFDETTPHMHFDFVPMTKDNKLSRKEVMTRDRLIRIQDELPRYMKGKGFDIERGQKMSELPEKERLEHKHVDHYEYKKQLQGQINALEGQIGALENKKALLVDEEKKEGLKRQIRAQKAQEKEKKLQKQEKELESREKKLQAGISDHNQQIKSLQELPKGEKTLTGKIALQEQDFRKLVNSARKGILQEPELRESRRRNQELSNRYEELKQKMPTIQERMELQLMKQENKELKAKNEKLETVLEKLRKMNLPAPAQKLIGNVLDSFSKVLQKEKNQEQGYSR